MCSSTCLEQQAAAPPSTYSGISYRFLSFSPFTSETYVNISLKIYILWIKKEEITPKTPNDLLVTYVIYTVPLPLERGALPGPPPPCYVATIRAVGSFIILFFCLLKVKLQFKLNIYLKYLWKMMRRICLLPLFLLGLCSSRCGADLPNHITLSIGPNPLSMIIPKLSLDLHGHSSSSSDSSSSSSDEHAAEEHTHHNTTKRSHKRMWALMLILPALLTLIGLSVFAAKRANVDFKALMERLHLKQAVSYSGK